MKGNIADTNSRKYLSPARKRDFSSADRKRAYNRELFAVVAPRYRTATRCLSFGRDATWKRILVNGIRRPLVRPQQTAAAQPVLAHPADRELDSLIVDLACGTGDITLALAERFPGARVHGIDISAEMLNLARRRAERNGVANAAYQLADMHALPFASFSVSLVTGGYALRNAPHLQTALREVSRVLIPGGQAAFLEFSTASHPLLRAVQLRLLMLWGRIWGTLLHRDPEVYAYIARSLKHFPDREQLRSIFTSAGLQVRGSRTFLGGFVRALWLEKRAAAD